MNRVQEALKHIRSIVAGKGDRTERAKKLALAVRGLGNHRWTGVYDVGSEMVSIVAYPSAAHGTGASTGPGAPAYLTVFGSTLSEMDRAHRASPKQHGGRHGSMWKASRQTHFRRTTQKLLEEGARTALPWWLG